MSLVAWTTIVIATVIVFFTAVGLLRVVLHLRHISQRLDALIGGVNAIAVSTSTVPEVVPSVNANLAPVRAWSESV